MSAHPLRFLDNIILRLNLANYVWEGSDAGDSCPDSEAGGNESRDLGHNCGVNDTELDLGSDPVGEINYGVMAMERYCQRCRRGVISFYDVNVVGNLVARSFAGSRVTRVTWNPDTTRYLTTGDLRCRLANKVSAGEF